jgi:hypothetical protein
VANKQLTTQGSTQKTDPYLKYLGGNFTYRPSKYNENLWKYTCNQYCTPKSKVPNLWADFKKIKAMGEGPAQCCKGVMYVPHLDGVGQWPYFTSTHQCGWEVPRLLLGERDDRTPFNLVQPSHGTGALTSPATRAALIKVLEEEDGIWENVTRGGAGKRKYAVNLHKLPEVKAKVEEAMSWYIDYVKHQYPALCHIKVGALKTSPNKISQYKQHSNRLHLL